MMKLNDPADQIDEPKSARMEQRTKPRIKAEIQKAAALLGMDESTFVMSAAYERALATIRNHEVTVLTAEDMEIFLSALDGPADPPPALLDAVKRSRQLIRNGG